MKEEIKLSIVLLTYNHEKYIAQALESILMQKVDFDYELIVCEDCSTDGTRDIILQYADKFKNIKLCFNKKNYGMLFNFMMSKYNCSDANYIALLEGDDYWTDPNKLQQQIDFLDKNDDFVGCSHDTEMFYEKEQRRVRMSEGKTIKSVNEISDIIEQKFYAHTSSYVWRNIFKEEYPKEMCYNLILTGDWLLSMLYAKNGKIKYIDKVMTCYRLTGNGIWTRLSEPQRHFNSLRVQQGYDKLLDCETKFATLSPTLSQRCNWFLFEHKKTATIDLKIKTWLLKWATYKPNRHSIENRIISKLSRTKPFDKIIQKSQLLKFVLKLLTIFMIAGLRVTSKVCEFLFNSLFLFDINRYYIYYKINIYRFLKIKIYKDLGN